MMWDMVIESFGSAFIAGLISWCISKSTAKAEIKKLRETWEHEKETVVNAEFDNMISAVSFFIRSPSGPTGKAAIEKTALFRSKANGELAVIVDELSDMLLQQYANYGDISLKLNEAVKIKRGDTN